MPARKDANLTISLKAIFCWRVCSVYTESRHFYLPDFHIKSLQFCAVGKLPVTRHCAPKAAVLTVSSNAPVNQLRNDPVHGSKPSTEVCSHGRQSNEQPNTLLPRRWS